MQVLCTTAYGSGLSVATKVSMRFSVPAAAEDKLGWHGKTLPKDMAEMVIKDLQSRVMNSSKHLYPAAPMEDAPPVSLRNIRMPSAPSYKPGEKVCRHPRSVSPALNKVAIVNRKEPARVNLACRSSQMTTRKAYGMALAKLGRYNERVVAVDGDTNNLTYSEIFKNEHPNRFVECYIAQQNMVGCL